jgi:protein-S-isoprenylcysteine O-methyltransferase Ste14
VGGAPPPGERSTFVLARALTYSTVFVALLLLFVPRQVLSISGAVPRSPAGPLGVVGLGLALLGMALAVWCVLAFVALGKGTPAPFDPPRRLVVRGPYRFIRNPMYLGAGVALGGVALFYRSLPLAIYAAGFLLAAHLFVVGYEEPTLTRLFGADYAAYRARVGRWLPGR